MRREEHSVCLNSMWSMTVSVPHEATNTETMTHSIYTIFLPTALYVHMEKSAQAPKD
jgi:hypothetical protein